MFEVSEADEAAVDKETALYNLWALAAMKETDAVIAMYERAAWGAGATVRETEEILRRKR